MKIWLPPKNAAEFWSEIRCEKSRINLRDRFKKWKNKTYFVVTLNCRHSTQLFKAVQTQAGS